MAVVQTHLTLDEFLKLPEEKPALEFEDGVVIQKVSPKGQHSALQPEIAERVNRVGIPGKIARAFSELRASYGGRSYVPDLSVYRWDRIPINDAGKIAHDFFDPPDIAFEIVSPQQSVTGRVRRYLWYVENGVQIAVLIEPDDESVLVFRAGQTPQALHGDDRIDLDEVLPGFDLTVQELFDSLRMP